MDEKGFIFLLHCNPFCINILSSEDLQIRHRIEMKDLDLPPSACFQGTCMSCGYGKLQVTFTCGEQVGVAAYKLVYAADDESV